VQGEVLHFFGQTLKVWDAEQHRDLYFSKRALVKILIGKESDLSRASINRVATKILEVINPYTAKKVDALDLKKCVEAVSAGTIKAVLTKLDAIKDHTSPFNKLSYKVHVAEVGDRLKPGDIIVRKYHEDNPNPICDLQKIFYKCNYREAYKHSHVALYLGKRPDGKHWIAEASLPHGSDPQIRRLRLDDERFELKDKNQYLVFRGNNEEIAQEAARLAALYTIKLLPTKEVSLENQEIAGFKYNRLEAFRSLFHFKNFGFFAKQRIFKYYSDYANQIPFLYITNKRNMFCSEFAFLSIQMSEVRKNQVFQEIIEKNPPPKFNKKTASGITGFSFHRLGIFCGHKATPQGSAHDISQRCSRLFVN
jgi:hypothetical protein